MKIRLDNTNKTHLYLNKLPKIYLVCLWAKYGVWELPLAKWVKNKNGDMIPYVYQYDDFNGTDDVYCLRPITMVTTGWELVWTMHKATAERIAEAMNLQLKESYKTDETLES